MPRGDGYTEWFQIEVLSEVTAFLADHRDKLGVGDVRALSIPEAPAKKSGSITISESREDRAKRRARLQEERFAHARQHNAQVHARFKDILSEIKRDNAFAGIIRPKPDKFQHSGCLFLQGANRREWAEKIFVHGDECNHLIGSGSSSVFCSVYHDPNHPLTPITIIPEMLIENQACLLENEKYFPGWMEINALLLLHAHTLDSPEDTRLRNGHNALKASEAAFWAQLNDTSVLSR
ncbi:hypothetical protein [Burkholderia plantarii]|nr:hypothetical protein [Burkholderia plantarii]